MKATSLRGVQLREEIGMTWCRGHRPTGQRAERRGERVRHSSRVTSRGAVQTGGTGGTLMGPITGLGVELTRDFWPVRRSRS